MAATNKTESLNAFKGFLKASLRPDFSQYRFDQEWQTGAEPDADKNYDLWPEYTQKKFARFWEEIEVHGCGKKRRKQTLCELDGRSLRQAHHLELLVICARFREFGPQMTINLFYLDSTESTRWAKTINSLLDEVIFGRDLILKENSESALKWIFSGADEEADLAPTMMYDTVIGDLKERFGKYLNSSSTSAEYFDEESRLAEPTPRITLSQLAEDNNLSDNEILMSFMHDLTDSFGCDVVDYLYAVQETKRIFPAHHIWVSEKADNSWPDEDYEFGDGITGSVVFLEESSIVRCVGTNHVELDPRTSKTHIEAHKEAHNHNLRNWWCFPIFVNGALTYIIRVVNRLGADRKPAFWTTSDLMRIAEEIRALETAISTRRETSLDFSRTALTPQTWYAVKNMLLGENRDEALLRNLENEKCVFNALSYLMRVANCHVEGQQVSMSIAICNDPRKLNSIGITDSDITSAFIRPSSIATLNEDPIDQNSSSGIFDADMAIHAYDLDGTFCRLCEVTRSDTTIETFENHITKDDLRYIFQARKSGIIRIFGQDGFLGDIVMSESVGTWKARNKAEFESAIVDPTLDDENMSTAIGCSLSIAFEISERRKGGAIVVLPTDVPEVELGGESADDLNVFLDQDKDKAAILSAVDGALVFNIKKRLVKYACFFPAPSNKKIPSFGTRHNSAQHASEKWQANIIVVSENGGISFFRSGQMPLLKDQIQANFTGKQIAG